MAGQRTVAPQDDQREQEQLKIFGLRQEPASSREDNDALIDLPGENTQKLELKSSTKGSITTARDFGLDHIKNWRNKHILCSFYDPKGNEILWSLLIPNQKLIVWLDEQLDYIKFDLNIIEALVQNVDDAFLNGLREAIFSDKQVYPGEIVVSLLKKQMNLENKRSFLDVLGTQISPESLNKAIKERLSYLVSRGITRNNPHIRKSFIQKVVKEDPALRFTHRLGDYQSSSEWIRAQLSKYAI
jgi:hypothetical protein